MADAVLRRRLFGSFALALALAVSPVGSGAQDPPGDVRLVDRIVAVVDQDPILRSDIDQVIGLGLAERQEGESESALRRRVLDVLIERRLRFHEVGRFGSERVAVAAVEAEVERVRAGFPDPESFQERLRELDMTEEDLRQLLSRQLLVVHYIDERLGSRVFVSLEDIQAFYDQEMVPTLEAQGVPAPPLAQVREQIRALLKERRLNEEIERWTSELRRQADIEILIDDYPDTLPPVVERIDGAGSG